MQGNENEFLPYKVVYRQGHGEYEEKKSRFIANVVPVTSEKEAAEFIETIKKKYYDARHNCPAFIIGRNRELTRCSDDGEPSGTAGKPILEVLLGAGVTNVAQGVFREQAKKALEGAARQAALAGLGREEVLGILEGAWAKQEGSDGK